MKVRRRAAKRGETDMYVVPGPVRAGHGSGQWRRVVGGAQEHGNGPDWHWALAPEYDICASSFSSPRRTATFKALLEYERTRSTWVRRNYQEPWAVKY